VTPTQLRNLVHAAVSRAVNNGQRIEETVDDIMSLIARDTIRDFDAAGAALLELVADAIVFGTGAWAEAVAGALDGHADLDPTTIARTFLESYRALLVLWSELPLDVKVADAFQSARLDAQAGGLGYVLIDRAGRLQRLDPEHVVVDDHTRRS
jgi:hypothetical protein